MALIISYSNNTNTEPLGDKLVSPLLRVLRIDKEGPLIAKIANCLERSKQEASRVLNIISLNFALRFTPLTGSLELGVPSKKPRTNRSGRRFGIAEQIGNLGRWQVEAQFHWNLIYVPAESQQRFARFVSTYNLDA